MSPLMRTPATCLLLATLLGCDAGDAARSKQTQAPSTGAVNALVVSQPEAEQLSKPATPEPNKASVTACAVARVFTRDDHGDNASSATALKIGEALGGKLERGGDVDCFAVELVAGRSYSFSAHGYGQLSVTVLGPDERQRVQGTKQVRYTPRSAGKHYVLIRTPNEQPCSYFLQAEATK